MKIVIYKKMTVAAAKKDIKAAKKDIVRWFKNSPRRRVCNVQIWYDRMVKINKSNVEKQLDNILNDSIAAGDFA